MSKWNYELLKNEALKYNTRSDFNKNSKGAYHSAYRLKILDEICSHMLIIVKNNYTIEEIKNEALKYKTKFEFQKGSNSFYQYAYKKKLLNDVCKHMKIVGNKFNRFIYYITFPRIKSVYVGLTYDLDKRKKSHLTKSSNKTVRYLLESGEKYEWMEYQQIFSQDESSKIEKEFIKNFKQFGWNVLNKTNGGEMGGIPFWDYKKVKKEAFKYEKRIDFQKNSPRAYEYARKNKILDEVCSHMKSRFLTYEIVKNKASKFDTIKEFRKNANSEYEYTKRNNLIGDICHHMK